MGIVSALLHQQQIQSFEDAFGVKDVTTPEMRRAIQAWFALYFDGDAPPEEDDCQRIPAIIVHKLYKTAFSEYSAAIARDGAEWLSGELERLNRKSKTAVQYQLVGGECLIKPVLWGGALDFTLIRRDCFLPIARDADGKLLSVGTVENTAQGGWYYSLLERRTVEADGALTIESRLFRSRDGSTLGEEVSLQSLPKYEQLQPVLRLPGIGSVGLAQLRTPLFNCVDGTSDAVSVYAPAVGLIKNINRNERQFCDEFENMLGAAFGVAPAMEGLGETQSDAKDLLRNTISATVNKVYLDRYLEGLSKAAGKGDSQIGKGIGAGHCIHTLT